MDINFINRITFFARLTPDKPALIFDGHALSYAQLHASIVNVEKLLAESGIRRHNFAGVLCDDKIKQVVTSLALMRAGVTSMPLNENYLTVAMSMGMDFLITDRPVVLPNISVVKFTDDVVYDAPAALPVYKDAQFKDSQAAVVWFSSGTTGTAKPLACSWSSLSSGLDNFKFQECLLKANRVAVLFPVTIYPGLRSALSYLINGRTVILFKHETELFDGAGILNIDTAYMSVFQSTKFIKQIESSKTKFRRLANIAVAGSQVSKQLYEKILSLAGENVLIYLGATEAGIIACRQAGALGNPDSLDLFILPCANIEIVDEAGQLLPPGEAGIIRILTTQMSAPYAGLARDYNAGADEWFYPGDCGYLHEDGRLTLTGRISEIINIGGIKMAPDMIEEDLRKHVDIEDCAAISRMSEQSGMEEIHVFIVAKTRSQSQELENWCAQTIAHLEARNVHFIDAIPRTAAGKIARHKLPDHPAKS